MPAEPSAAARHYATVARAIRYLRAHAGRQPSLRELADAVGLSEHHLQRVFSEWAGISPKRFLQFLTKEHAKQALRESHAVLDAAIDAGLSGPGRLHDLMVSCEAMTPGEIAALGQGLTIGHGFAPTPFGEALFGWTPRGVCHLEFCDGEGDRDARLRALKAHWPEARFARDDARAAALAREVFARAPEPRRLHVVVHGTNFQIRVWEALLRTGPGTLLSYGQLAELAGSPGAARAAGSALAANAVGWLIPCHRVIRESGEPGQWRWGADRKLALLAWEAAEAAGRQPSMTLAIESAT